jgi:FixJ family two-component response regulator
MSRRRLASGQRVASERPADTATSPTQTGPVATRRPTATDTEAAVLATLANDRGITNAELARAVGVSTRTARRYRTRLASVANGTDH